MKKVLIYPICFISTCAIAKTTFYYETGGQCPVNTGLFLNPNATSCSEAVTKVTTPTASGRSFAGFYVGSTQVIDSNGNILVNSSTAPNLFDASAETHNAQAVYTGTNTITVRESNYWVAGDKYIGWYTCADFGYHMCQTDGAYVAPPAGLCHSYGVNPTNGYDYKFNSWVLGANHNTFVPASCYNGLSETCPRQDGCWCNHYSNGEIASGNSSKPGACTESMLGPFEAVKGKFSLQNVYPFACKRFYVNGTWTDQVDVANGKIILENSTPGQCRYHLTCNEGYHSGSNGSDGYACEGVACRGFFNGNYQELGITAPCVQDTPTTCPTMQNPDNGSINQPTPTNGTCNYTVTCDNSSNDYGYACDTTTGLCTKSCTVGSDCNNLKSQYTGAQHQLCKRCPTVNELNISSQLSSGHTTLELSEYDYSNKKCKYNVSCNEGYNGSIETIDCNLSNGNCNGTTLLNLISNHQCSLACPTVEQLGIDDDLAFAHLSAQYSHQSYGACYYDFECIDGCVGTDFTQSCTPGFNCDSDRLLGNHHCTCPSDCPDVYSESGLNLGAVLAELNFDGSFERVDNVDHCVYRFSCLPGYTNSYYTDGYVDFSYALGSSSDWIGQHLSEDPCTFECPSVASLNLDDELAAHHATLIGPITFDNNTCGYELSCNSNYTGINLPFRCQGQECGNRYTFLNRINNFECNYQCPGTIQIFPPLSGPPSGYVHSLNTTLPCSYNVSCNNLYDEYGYEFYGFVCDNNTGMCNIQTCNNEENCNTLHEQYNAIKDNLCIMAPDNLQISAQERAAEHVDVYQLISFNYDTTRTIYRFNCESGYHDENSGNHYGNVSCELGSTDKPCTKDYIWNTRILAEHAVNCVPNDDDD